MSSIASSSAALSPIERALQQSLHPRDYRDVHLYAFTRRTVFPDGSTWIDLPRPVAAMSSILSQTEYFRELLTSGFSETNEITGATGPVHAIREYALPDEYDYDSDSDLEEAGFDDFDESSALNSSRCGSPAPLAAFDAKGKGKDAEYWVLSTEATHRRILLPSVAHRTLSACVYYIYTERLNFLPLRSQDASKPQRALFANGREAVAPPCSPKSMYRLADLYGMSELQQMAYDAILERLSPDNIVEEAFSRFFARYDRLREHAVSYLVQVYSDPRVEASLREMLDKVAQGQLPHASGLLCSLLGIRMALTRPESPLPRDSWSKRSTWGSEMSSHVEDPRSSY
ncbi:hypothetical protein BD414DRAFT_476823 [Trametes punicea]|nr:hypothetical protein BD414DRAFT_476823 [Trametes punicea]